MLAETAQAAAGLRANDSLVVWKLDRLGRVANARVRPSRDAVAPLALSS